MQTGVFHLSQRYAQPPYTLLTITARRFRDFVNFTAYLDVRPNDDIIDVLGFLSFEMVRSLCVTALEVRAQLSDSAPENKEIGPATRSPTKRPAQAEIAPTTPSKRAKGDGTTDGDPAEETPVATFISLFAPPPSARAPLLPSHILEAFARIQRAQANHRVGGMRNWRGGVSRAKVALV
jgi:transcription initiation protein SPT3